MGDLARDTAIVGTDDGRYAATLSADWSIWGPSGGYVAAIALRAAGEGAALPRPASFVCQFLAVAEFAPVAITVTPLRESKRAASLRVDVEQDGRPVLAAIAWFVADALDGIDHDWAPMPTVDGPDGLMTITERLDTSGRPRMPMTFWDSVDMRPAGWIDDWANRAPGDPVTYEWWRFPGLDLPVADQCVDAARLVVALDSVMWPAVGLAHTGELGFIAPSLDLAVQFHRAAPEAEWLLTEGRAPVATGGLIGGRATAWAPDGRALASASQQMMCRPMAMP